MGDCWLLPSIQGCTQVRFGCLSPQEDTFMDTLKVNNWSRTFFSVFYEGISTSRCWHWVFAECMAEHTHHTEDSQHPSVTETLRLRTSGLFCSHFCGLHFPKNVDGKEIRHSFPCVKVSTTSWLPKAQNLHLLLPECQKPHLFSTRQSPQPVIKAILHYIILEVEVWDRINQILFSSTVLHLGLEKLRCTC